MRNKIKWTEELPRMVKMIEGGKTIRQLADIYGTSLQNISYGMERNGIRVRDLGKERLAKKREKQAQRKILSDARKELKKRDAFYKKFSDITSYNPSRRLYNQSKELKQDPKSIANRARQEAYREANWLKVLARKVVAYAIKRGYLVATPCKVCGCMENLEWHHYNGYERALDVECLCRFHHAEKHTGDCWKSDRGIS